MSLVILDEKGEQKMEKGKVVIKDKIEAYILLLIAIVLLWGLIFATTGRSAEISTNSFDPPKGNCKQGEVYRCTQGTCFSTLLYCLPVYEDGKLVSTSDCNTTTCSWNCECIKKDKPIETNQEWLHDKEMYLLDGEKAVEALQIIIDQIKKREEGDFSRLIPNQQWVPIENNITLLNEQGY